MFYGLYYIIYTVFLLVSTVFYRYIIKREVISKVIQKMAKMYALCKEWCGYFLNNRLCDYD